MIILTYYNTAGPNKGDASDSSNQNDGDANQNQSSENPFAGDSNNGTTTLINKIVNGAADIVDDGEFRRPLKKSPSFQGGSSPSSPSRCVM